MTTDKKQKLVLTLQTVATLLNTLLKKGVLKVAILGLIDVAIDIINDEDEPK